MEPSAGQLQEMGRENTMDNMLVCPKQNQQERKLARPPQQEEALKCPRCDSMNTKFCYYNNYSLSQPRYFCKSCRRYWTKGGTLRNVPVGGGCRKNKRSSSSSFSDSKKTQLENPNSNPLLSSLPPLPYDSNDLTLAFARLQEHPNGQLGFDHGLNSIFGNPNAGSLGYPNGFYGIEGCGSDQMVLPNFEDDLSGGISTQAVRVTTMKQETCDFGRGDVDQSKVLFGMPWINGDFDFGREAGSWNNVHGIGGSSSWHGVLNTPLM